MTRRWLSFLTPPALVLAGGLFITACTHGSAQEQSGAPPDAVVEATEAGSLARVDHPEQFPLVAADTYEARSALSVTGVVTNDVSRAVPVLSLASGRAVDVRVRLGDQVHQGQLLMRVKSSDISGAFSDYRHALADEILARAQLDRSKRLYARGAIAQKDLEIAQDTDDKAVVDVQTATERLKVLGVNPAEPPSDISIVDVMAPVSGVITEQNITNAGGVRSLDATPNLFTISDLSHVWIVCDVYENDLPNVRVGDSAEIRLNAYPDRMLTGRVSNILPILDPSLRTAKVRIEVANPGLMRLGMFVTAIFLGQASETRMAVPATAILHLHDRDWVYVPTGTVGFVRVEVVSGDSLGGNRQELRAGLPRGQLVVANALALQNTVEQ
jgi:cobalt-zinc-cadmium efflux system membrane fusion protein